MGTEMKTAFCYNFLGTFLVLCMQLTLQFVRADTPPSPRNFRLTFQSVGKKRSLLAIIFGSGVDRKSGWVIILTAAKS